MRKSVVSGLWGFGMEAVGQGAPVLWPGMPMVLALALTVGGLVMMGLGAAFAIGPWLIRRISIPNWLPERLKDRLDWIKYRPGFYGYVVNSQYVVENGKAKFCRAHVVGTGQNDYPYGSLKIIFDDAVMTLTQPRGHRSYSFTFKPMVNEHHKVLIPATQFNNYDINFVWDKEGEDAAIGPNLDLEFKWRIVGMRASLIGPRVIDGALKNLSETKRGPRAL